MDFIKNEVHPHFLNSIPYYLINGVQFSAEAVPPFYKQKDRRTVADDLHRKRSPVKNPECPSHVPHTSVPVPACKPGVSIRNRFQVRNTEKTVKGYDIRRILFRFFPHKKELPHRKNRRGSSFCRNLYRRYGTHRRQEHTYLPKTAT